MRPIIRSLVLSVAMLMPNIGTAQVFSRPTPPPDINAASADWQIRSEPIFHAGSFYYPAGPTAFFDGRLMVRTGVYQGVPLYADTTLEPFSIVYVPIGRNVMRPYERRREGALAGTVGSRPPSFPVQEPSGVGTPGADVPRAVPLSGGVVARSAPPRPVPSYIPRSTSNDGVWIEFNGARWFSSGGAVSYDPDRFIPVGEYRGFVVYRDKTGRADTIYVTAVPDGPIAPYTRR